MTQAIDPIKLKAAAEHLEWVLKQYPDSEDVQSLLRALLPLVEDAKACKVLEPVDSMDIPGAYNFSDGVYEPYKDPDVGTAYARFSIEMRGGLTEQDKKRRAEMEAYRKTLLEAKS
jgi:gamma-glutamyl-gamma-aminobutyrate hydrolase PuuD